MATASKSPRPLRAVPGATHRRRMTKDQKEALEWVKERARPRDTKRAALPEAEGAAIDEPSHPARPADQPWPTSGAAPLEREPEPLKRSPTRKPVPGRKVPRRNAP